MPLISVVMSCKDSEQYLSEAIESILSQTVSCFEFLIMDDGSIDGTPSIIRKYKSKDCRIKSFSQSESKGLSSSLNILIRSAKGKYIARMDADDISMSERFGAQLAVLEDGRVDICGTWVANLIGRKVKSVTRYPVPDELIKEELVFQSALAHPSVMFDRRVLEGREAYDVLLPAAQDYDLWVRLSNKFVFQNIPEPLLYYRKHERQITNYKSNTQWIVANQIRNRRLANLGVKVDQETMDTHNLIRKPAPLESLDQLERIALWLSALKVEASLSSEVVCKNWFLSCVKATHLGFSVVFFYLKNIRNLGCSFGIGNVLILSGLSLFKLKYNSYWFNRLTRRI